MSFINRLNGSLNEAFMSQEANRLSVEIANDLYDSVRKRDKKMLEWLSREVYYKISGTFNQLKTEYLVTSQDLEFSHYIITKLGLFMKWMSISEYYRDVPDCGFDEAYDNAEAGREIDDSCST